MRNKRTFGWFLFGLGGQLQIVASLSFTEIFVLATAPILFLKELGHMKKNGVILFFYLSLALVIGCVVSCIANHTRFDYALRGLAVCCLMPCSIIVVHWMFRRDMDGVKWSFLGAAIGGILCTFVFQKSVEVSAATGGVGAASAADIASGINYWIQRLSAFVLLPARGWYLNCPTFYCVGAPLFIAGFSLLTSVSGRGSFVRAVATSVLVLLGGKTRRSIQKNICKRFFLLIMLSVFGAFAVKTVYQTAATKGWLGEQALQKYESQTKGKTSFTALLLGGRMESFCGLLACVDKPIIGFGPWAIDHAGYRATFLAKYADEEDYAQYLKFIGLAQSRGFAIEKLIPCHSVFTELWLWYGIAGLIFCLYMFYVMLRYLKEDCWAVPQWFFWVGASIPGMFWDMTLNPLQARVGLMSFVVACLLVRAVREGRLQLPYEMIREIEENERK